MLHAALPHSRLGSSIKEGVREVKCKDEGVRQYAGGTSDHYAVSDS